MGSCLAIVSSLDWLPLDDPEAHADAWLASELAAVREPPDGEAAPFWPLYGVTITDGT